MPFKYHDKTVEIVCGSPEGGWVAVDVGDGDTEDIRIKNINDIRSDQGWRHLYETVREKSNEYPMDFDAHLPLKVEVGDSQVAVKTVNGEILYSLQTQMVDLDDPLDTLIKTARTIDDAHERPRKVLFEHRDELVAWPAEAVC